MWALQVHALAGDMTTPHFAVTEGCHYFGQRVLGAFAIYKQAPVIVGDETLQISKCGPSGYIGAHAAIMHGQFTMEGEVRLKKASRMQPATTRTGTCHHVWRC